MDFYFCVEWFADDTNDLLDQILQGHYAGSTPIFVKHDGDALAAGVELIEQGHYARRFGNEYSRAHHFLGSLGLLLRGMFFLQYILEVDNANDLIKIIFIDRKKIFEEYEKKRISKQLREKITGYLASEIECYNKWLQGEYVGFVVNEICGECGGDKDCDEEFDSCWGFDDMEFCMDEAESSIDHQLGPKPKPPKPPARFGGRRLMV